MKKAFTVLLVLALALTMTGCAKKSGVGDKGLLDFDESSEPSPTTTKTSTKPRTKKTTEPTKEPEKSSYEPRTYKINISNVNDQYQPRERVVLEGDILIFTNLDPSTNHSLTEGENQTAKDPAFDSGILKEGEKWKWTVDVKPGTYQFHCEVVPYIQGGPIKVLENSQL